MKLTDDRGKVTSHALATVEAGVRVIIRRAMRREAAALGIDRPQLGRDWPTEALRGWAVEHRDVVQKMAVLLTRERWDCKDPLLAHTQALVAIAWTRPTMCLRQADLLAEDHQGRPVASGMAPAALKLARRVVEIMARGGRVWRFVEAG